ncbi:MAG: multidrug efflux MFS transporter [Lentisphaerae bacterium]|nr:multidrug efflux MFS transporter [Lentisphaerota bacterium]
MSAIGNAGTAPQVSWKLNLAMLWFSQLLILAGFQAFIPFVPLFIKDVLGVTDKVELAAAITAFNFFGTMAYAVFNPIWGVLADRFGVKPMLLRGTFLTAVIFPAMAYSPTVFVLVLLRFLSAACAGTTAASQTMIVRNTPEKYQGFALGVLSTAIWGGAMLGFVIGGLLIDFYGYKEAFWFCGILYFISGIAILFTRDGEIRLVKVKSHIQGGFFSRLLPKFTHAVWVLLMLFMVLGFVRSFEIGYVALKIEEMTSPASAAFWTGVSSAIVCGAAIFSGVLFGYLSDRYPVVCLIVPVMLIAAVTMVIQGATGNLWIFTAGRVLLYAAAGGMQPVLQKVLSSITPPRKRGAVFGFASSTQCFGNMIAFALSGLLMPICGVSWLFHIGAVFFIIFLPAFIGGITFATRPFVLHNLSKLRKKRQLPAK